MSLRPTVDFLLYQWLDAEELQVFLAHVENVRYLKPDDNKPPPAAPPRGVRSRGVEI